jgi:hypothetical protein
LAARFDAGFGEGFGKGFGERLAAAFAAGFGAALATGFGAGFGVFLTLLLLVGGLFLAAALGDLETFGAFVAFTALAASTGFSFFFTLRGAFFAGGGVFFAADLDDLEEAF